MTNPVTHVLAARGIKVALDLGLGQLALFEVLRDGRKISPFARVPWADDPEDKARFAADMAPHLRRMSGDFFCAPFCADDVEGAPAHGWSANSAWDLVDEGRATDFPGPRALATGSTHDSLPSCAAPATASGWNARDAYRRCTLNNGRDALQMYANWA